MPAHHAVEQAEVRQRNETGRERETAVSELQFWDTSGKLISVNTPTYGPEPLVTNGEFAPEGHSSTDKSYAFILPPCQKDKGGGGHSQARYARPRRLRRRPL